MDCNVSWDGDGTNIVLLAPTTFALLLTALLNSSKFKIPREYAKAEHLLFNTIFIKIDNPRSKGVWELKSPSDEMKQIH